MHWKKTETLRMGIASSAILRFFCDFSGSEQRFEEGRFGRGISPKRRSEIRRACLRAREKSLFFRAFRLIGTFLLRGSVGSYGSFFVLSTLFGVLGRLALGTFSVRSVDFLIGAVLLASSVLLLHSGQSMTHAIGSSLFFEGLLGTVCRLPRDRFVIGEERGVDRPWLVLLLSLLCGAAACFVRPIWLLLTGMMILALVLFQAIPELLMLLLLYGMPLLSLGARPTFYLLCGVALVELLWIGKALCGHRSVRFGVLDFFVLLFAAFLLIGGAFGVSGWSSLFRSVSLLILLLSYFPMKSLFSHPVWRRRALVAISASALLCAGIGIFQYVMGEAELKWVDVSRFSDIGGRVTSLFGNPNVFGVYLLLTLPISLSGVMTRRGWMRIVFGITLIAELICLLLTWSRGAWLGAIASVSLLLLLFSKATRYALLWSVLPIAVWSPLAPHSVANRFASIGMLGESSIRYRLYTWRGTLRMLRAYPFGIGVGEEAFFAVYRRFAVSGTETVMHTHNLFLQIAMELGIVGLLCFLALLLLLLRALLDDMVHTCEEKTHRVILLSMGCALAGVLVMGLFDNVWYHYGLFWMFFVWIGAIVGMIEHERAHAVEEIRKW